MLKLFVETVIEILAEKFRDFSREVISLTKCSQCEHTSALILRLVSSVSLSKIPISLTLIR